MTFFKSFVAVFFGPSWRTSLLGYLSGAATIVGTQLSGRTEPGWLIVGMALMALGRAGKDSSVTGGTAPANLEAAARVLENAQETAVAEQLARASKRVTPALVLLALALSGCAGVSALSGSTGPITITTTKDAAGATVPSSTVTVTAGPARLVGGSCLKPVSATFSTLTGQTDTCSVQVPLKPAADGSCP